MRRAALTLVASAVLGGCASPQPGSQVGVPAPAPQGRTSSGSTPTTVPPATVPSAGQGRAAASTRVRFVPRTVVLPEGARAEVQPAATVNGKLKVPERVRHVGWWDGSSYAGDPFGSTVIAGHVDSATEGVGFFARLLQIRVGDQVGLRGDGHQARYRVRSVQLVAKDALASDGRAFDQSGDHRLVLITCAGDYYPDRGGYDSNLVVTAVPIGLAR